MTDDVEKKSVKLMTGLYEKKFFKVSGLLSGPETTTLEKLNFIK